MRIEVVRARKAGARARLISETSLRQTGSGVGQRVFRPCRNRRPEVVQRTGAIVRFHPVASAEHPKLGF